MLQSIYFRGTARNVQCGNAKPADRVDNNLSCLSRHNFGPLWTCVYVAMLARLITKLAYIHLERINRCCAQLYAEQRQLFVEALISARL